MYVHLSKFTIRLPGYQFTEILATVHTSTRVKPGIQDISKQCTVVQPIGHIVQVVRTLRPLAKVKPDSYAMQVARLPVNRDTGKDTYSQK